MFVANSKLGKTFFNLVAGIVQIVPLALALTPAASSVKNFEVFTKKERRANLE
jgi:hypothetical protein